LNQSYTMRCWRNLVDYRDDVINAQAADAKPA